MSSVLQKVSLVTTDQFCLAWADPKGWNRCYQRFIQHISQLSSWWIWRPTSMSRGRWLKRGRCRPTWIIIPLSNWLVTLVITICQSASISQYVMCMSYIFRVYIYIYNTTHLFWYVWENPIRGLPNRGYKALPSCDPPRRGTSWGWQTAQKATRRRTVDVDMAWGWWHRSLAGPCSSSGLTYRSTMTKM